MLVIVATDGSEPAGIGVELVARAAWPPETSVRVLGAIEPLPLDVVGPFGIFVGVDPATADVIDESAIPALEQARGRMAAVRLRVDTSLRRGRPATAILEAIRELQPDLVVLGSRGHGTIEMMLLGSVSAEVVDHSPKPVLVARGDSVERVILGYDGSPSASRAAELLRWPMFARSSITIVAVAPPPIPWWSGFSGAGAPSVVPLYVDSAAAIASARDEGAMALASELRAGGLSVTAELRAGDAAEELIAASRASSADLIVIGSHGNAGLPRVLLGSVARNVLAHAHCSVLVSR